VCCGLRPRGRAVKRRSAPQPIRELRDLTRYRVSLVQEINRIANRIQKVLEDANIKLASVATDALGASGRAILEAMLAGEQDAARLAEMSKGLLYRRIAARRGATRAVMAVAHTLLEIAYHMLKRKEDYRELGADHFDRIDVNRIRRSLVRRLERLGHKVTLEPLALTA
jgi:hypothetical protein